MFAGDKGEEEVCHGALAEHSPEEEEAGAAPSGPALPRGLPPGGQAVLPARKAPPPPCTERAPCFLLCPPCNSHGFLTFNGFSRVSDTV